MFNQQYKYIRFVPHRFELMGGIISSEFPAGVKPELKRTKAVLNLSQIQTKEHSSESSEFIPVLTQSISVSPPPRPLKPAPILVEKPIDKLSKTIKQYPLKEVNTSIRSAMTELQCCKNDLSKYTSDNQFQHKFIDTLKNALEKYISTNIQQPNTEEINIDLNNATETINQLGTHLYKFVKILFSSYVTLLHDINASLKEQNIPQYDFADYKRICENNVCRCDITIKTGECLLLFANQKLIRIRLPTAEINKMLKDALKNTNYSSSELQQIKLVSSYFDEIDTILNNYLIDINKLKTEIDGRYAQAVKSLKKDKKFKKIYGDIIITSPQLKTA